MFVECLDVGKTVASNKPMAISDISSQLQADWMPSLPPEVSTSFIGWPPFLIETLPFR